MGSSRRRRSPPREWLNEFNPLTKRGTVEDETPSKNALDGLYGFNPLTKRGTVEVRKVESHFLCGLPLSFNPLTKRGTVEDAHRGAQGRRGRAGVSIPSLSGAQWRGLSSRI